jgi:SAM-dependent methyltransferase
MGDSPQAWPFADAAPYYDAGRPPYAPGALEMVVAAFGIGPGARVLDLGCGPGTVAIPLSRLGAAVVAVDPDPAMLSEARRLAASRGAGRIDWICARAEDALAEAGPFRLVTFGQSLHWMDRDRVLAGLGAVVEDGGGLAIFDEPSGYAGESWARAAAEIVRKYVGRPARHPMKHAESAHEPSLLRSASFSRFETHRFDVAFTRTPASILGYIYSGVHTTKAAFGDAAERFEAELMAALDAMSPSGEFRERAETFVLIARKAPAEAANVRRQQPTSG